MRNHAWGLAELLAQQIVAGYGVPGSQESEVLAAASVGQAGLALAHAVLAALELDRVKPPADTSWLVSFRPPAEVQAILDQREWERGGALKRLAEALLGPEGSDAPAK